MYLSAQDLHIWDDKSINVLETRLEADNALHSVPPQGCLGTNVTFFKNTAKSGGDKVYLADATAANSLFNDGTEQASPTRPAPLAIQQGRSQCSQQDVNKANSTLKIAGPPCGLVLWSPAAGTLLPYVNNGSGLPTINATVVDCWCSRVQQIPGEEYCYCNIVQALPEDPVGS